MKESLHEAAMRFTGHRGCKGGCAYCANGENRGENGVCLVRRIAQCSNADEQIEWMRQWQKENPAKPKWVRLSVYKRLTGGEVLLYACGNCGYRIPTHMMPRQYKYCPECGKEMEIDYDE